MMNKQDQRHGKILEVLKAQGVGVVNICNEKLAFLIGVSTKTIQRDIIAMTNKSIIVKETTLIRSNGQTRKQRDIILKGEVQRRFTLVQHKQLSDKSNHRIYTNEFNEVIWDRCINGEWQRSMVDKEFRDEKQAYNWLYYALNTHYKNYTNGDNYTSRT